MSTIADLAAHAGSASVGERPVGAEHEATLTIAADHPALAGHFPGNPLVPGVVLLDEAIASIERARGMTFGTYRLASVKFLQPVKPPATLTVRHRAGGSDSAPSIDFAIDDCSIPESGSRLVASGRIDGLAPGR